jgi:hypothetical protein
MEQMYQEYKNIAEFRIVYIREAHAADSRQPTTYAVEKDIKQPQDYEARCVIAEMLIADGSLTIPIVIDTLDDKVNDLYMALPSRVYLVRKDGKIGVAGWSGAGGFAPGLTDVKKWLVHYKETGEEPELPEK